MNLGPPVTDTVIDTAPPAWHRVMLQDLAELTLELARAVQRQAIHQAAAAPADQTTGAGLLYTRIARTLRQTIALDARLAADQQRGSATERARRAAAERHRKHAARTEIRRRLADTVEADPRDTESLLQDLDDRLYDGDIDAALTIATITDIVQTLCAEFGLTPNLAHLTDAELAAYAPPPHPRPAAHAHPP